jgi:hypothetical protein
VFRGGTQISLLISGWDRDFISAMAKSVSHATE